MVVLLPGVMCSWGAAPFRLLASPRAAAWPRTVCLAKLVVRCRRSNEHLRQPNSMHCKINKDQPTGSAQKLAHAWCHQTYHSMRIDCYFLRVTQKRTVLNGCRSSSATTIDLGTRRLTFVCVLSFPCRHSHCQKQAIPSPEPLTSSSTMPKIPSGRGIPFLLVCASRFVKVQPSRDLRGFLQRNVNL